MEQGNGDPNDKIVELIRKCLALSNSPNEHEASAAMQKAQELLEKYNLNMEQVSVEEKSAPALFKGDVGEVPRNWRRLLYGGVANLNFCRVISSYGRLYVLGRLPNVIATHDMAEWLAGQIDRLAIAESATYEQCDFDMEHLRPYKVRWETRREFMGQFRFGAVKRVLQRLRDASVQRQEANPNLRALVVNLSAEVAGFLDREFPHRAKSGYNYSPISNGYQAGHVAGDKVGLTPPSRHVEGGGRLLGGGE